MHFLAKDCEFNTLVSRLLSEIGAIEASTPKAKRPKVGQILTTPFKNHNIFSLVILDHYYTPLDATSLKKAMRNLRELLLRKNLHNFHISRKGDFSDKLDPGLLSEIIVDTFKGTPIEVTMCYGRVDLPIPEERPQIIETLHSSLIGRHKGANQTYRKIRERYYWPGMRNGVLDYIRRCSACQERKIERNKTLEPMILTDTPIEAFDKVSIDTVGKLLA